MNQLFIPQKIFQELMNFTTSELPYESCGFLGGKNNYVQSFWPLENELKSQKQFYVSQSKVEQTYQSIKHQNEELLAAFHTHPTTRAIPSLEDIKYHFSNEILMMIISFRERKPIIKCYHVQGRRYNEIDYVIYDTDS